MNKNSFFLLACILLLFSVGSLMVFNTSSGEILDRHLNISTHQSFIKQLAYAMVSLMAALFLGYIGYRPLFRWSPYLFFATTLLLIAVYIPGIGREINGAKRWIAVGSFSFQPSEFMKGAMPLYFIYLFFQKEQKLNFKRFYTIMLLFLVPFFLIIMEPDNGTAAILMMVMIALFFLLKIRLSYWLLPMLFVGGMGVLFASQMPYVKKRIEVYLHPEGDLLGKGHQPYQAKIAAGSGKIFGRGLGESLQKLNYLPEARSDYIAAIYAEEFGFVGILFLVVLYMVIGYSGFRIASKAEDKEGFYLATILTFLISFQAFLNLGVVSGLLPSKGTNLPFFSQGGTSLIANTLAITMIISISNQTREERKQRWKKTAFPVDPGVKS